MVAKRCSGDPRASQHLGSLLVTIFATGVEKDNIGRIDLFSGSELNTAHFVKNSNFLPFYLKLFSLLG